MKVVIYDDKGGLSISSDEIKSPAANEVLVKVIGSGINRADLLQRKGLYPPPTGASDLLGLEVAGMVEKVGSQVNSLKVGDNVMGLLAGGGYAEYVTDDAGLFMRVPDAIDLLQAAAIPEVFLTAYQVLFHLAALKPNETVLIHAGASGLGSAAIQLAKTAGAKVIVTAGSESKLAFCQKLGADLGINYKKEDFEVMIKEEGGVDVVLDVVGGGHFPKNLSVLNSEGRYLVVAFMAGNKADLDLSAVLRKRISIMGTTLRSRSLPYKQKLIQSFLFEFGESFANGSIIPVIDTVYTYQEVEKAHQYMASNQNMGKLLLNWR